MSYAVPWATLVRTIGSPALMFTARFPQRSFIAPTDFELPPGGLFLNLDATVPADAALAAQTYDAWSAGMRPHGIDDATARAHFAEWASEDRYFSLHEELDALARAGFAAPECFWRRAPVTVYGGRASASLV